MQGCRSEPVAHEIVAGGELRNCGSVSPIPMVPSSVSRRVLLAVSVLLGVGFLSCSAAPSDQKAAFDPKGAKDGGLGMPTPYDKFIALDQVMPPGTINWGQTFRKVAVDLDPDQFTDKDIAIPMALGIRIADGVMAIKARDVELLNRAASDIEKLAQRMGIADTDLTRARAVRAFANKKEWLSVFMELGFLQQTIMGKLDDKSGDRTDSNRGTLLIVSGWMQGARYVTTIITDHYSASASNILREPLLVQALSEKINALPAAMKSNPAVAKCQETLPKMKKTLTIPLDGSISKEDVGELNKQATEVVKLAAGLGAK